MQTGRVTQTNAGQLRAAGSATTRPAATPSSGSMRSERLRLVPSQPEGAAPYSRDGALPPLPTLLATRLQMELLLAEHPVDLRAAAGVLLSDIGATLEIFRRAGEEYGVGPEAPARLEDCLASLGTEVWMDVICANAVERVAPNGPTLTAVTCFWEHARLLACACWLVAEQMEGVCPEEAFLVGLLHEASRLPTLLGWSRSTAVSSELAVHWRLPDYLRAVVAEMPLPPRWQEILELAHVWARGEDCLLTHTA